MTQKATTQRKTKERGNGQGTVWKEGNIHRWQVTLGYGTDGKRITKSGRAATKKAAMEAMDKVRVDFARGLIGAPERVTVREFGERWQRRRVEVSERTQTLYRIELEYALKHIGNMRVQEVRPSHLKDLMLKLSEEPSETTGKPLAPRTQAKVATHLRSMFREAVVDQIIYVSPMEGVKRGGGVIKESAGNPLDFDQTARFHTIGTALYTASLLRLWPAVFTALSLGLRRGEVMGLTWNDLDLDGRILHVRQQSTLDAQGNVKLGKLKTTNARRDIHMPASLVAVLLAHREAQKAEQIQAGSAWAGKGAVFATELGNWTHPDNLKRAVQRVIEWSDPAILKRQEGQAWVWKGIPCGHRASLTAAIGAGEVLPTITPHDLRHTYATLALRRGVPVEVVSKILGHARVSITLDIYRHVLDNERRAYAIDFFEAAPPVPAGVPAALN